MQKRIWEHLIANIKYYVMFPYYCRSKETDVLNQKILIITVVIKHSKVSKQFISISQN